MANIIGKEISPITGGLIKVVDTMGDDSSIVQAARVSYGIGTTTTRKDRGLIRYLIRNLHTTPIEAVSIKFLLRLPMDVWRQWIRHRASTFSSINEYSTRYSIAIDETFKIPLAEWRKQSKINKQGSAEYFSEADGKRFSDQEEQLHKLSREIYEDRIEKGMAREQARKDLLLCTFTECYWTINLHNLFHFLGLRMDPHAQHEIRLYAKAIGLLVQEWCPLAWEAFEDYRLNSISLSSKELTLIKNYNSGNSNWAEYLEYFNKSERTEFNNKAELLGINLNNPWEKSQPVVDTQYDLPHRKKV